MGILIFIVVVLIIIISNIKIVPQAHCFIVERLGAFHAAWGVGLHVKIPFIEKIVKSKNLQLVQIQIINF